MALDTECLLDQDKGSILKRIARATQLREGQEGVATVLRIVYRNDKLPLREIAKLAKLPLPVVAAVRRELEKARLLERGPGLTLTETGRHFIENVLGIRSKWNFTCPWCDGCGILIDPILHDVLDRFRIHFARKPSVDTTIDQAPCTPETAFRRALYMYGTGAVEGRNILFVGDDDAVSVAVALLGKALGLQPFARRLTVVEIDLRWSNHILEISDKEELAIEFVQHDLRDPLPRNLCAAFDTFHTDPPYTLDGMKLFVARGIEALRPDIGQMAFLSFAELPPDDQLDLHRVLTSMGLAIMDVLPGFNRYEGASIRASIGQLIKLCTTSSTVSPLAGKRYDQPIYTGEVRITSRHYCCTRCGREFTVGSKHEIQTIEELKGRGCLFCGNDRFRLLRRKGEKDG